MIPARLLPMLRGEEVFLTFAPPSEDIELAFSIEVMPLVSANLRIVPLLNAQMNLAPLINCNLEV